MASAPSIRKIKEEAMCCICLQLMIEPMSIQCGHSFCRKCIEDIFANQHPTTSSLEKSYCPLCRAPFQKKDIRFITQLDKLIQTFKEIELCEEHGEELQLFCEDDGQLICWRCERSSQHKGHNTNLVEDVGPGYMKKLQKAVTELNSLEDQCSNLELITKSRITKWERKIELQRQDIQSDFENLHNFLHMEEKCFLWRLEKEKEQTLRRIQDKESRLQEHRQEIKNLIWELREISQQPVRELLQAVTHTLNRISAVEQNVPEAVSLKIHTMCNVSELYLDVKKMLRSYQVNVRLDPDTAHPEVIVSNDLRKMTRGYPERKQNNSRRFTFFRCVLGCEGFISGRHFFEVNVGEATQWTLGVCQENVSRSINTKLMPETGFWTIGLFQKKGYEALTSPVTFLSLSEEPLLVGVFLDYEAGLVSFHNMLTGSHIFTFPKASFSETLRPYFYVCPDSSLFLPPPGE